MDEHIPRIFSPYIITSYNDLNEINSCVTGSAAKSNVKLNEDGFSDEYVKSTLLWAVAEGIFTSWSLSTPSTPRTTPNPTILYASLNWFALIVILSILVPSLA